MKICVYAIAKNEEKFVKRWMDSMNEADFVVVLDTGSTDNTAKILKEYGAIVKTEIISPWRFDVARNKSLDLIPSEVDICVCTDLDEVLEAGWRKKLESQWTSETKRGQYRYTWSFNDDGSEGTVFWVDKIHSRHDFKWVNPVHEILSPKKEESYLTTILYGIQLNHFPDHTKPRSQYLPLLELSIEEDPTNDRNMHYLGREYMYYGKWNQCIDTLKKHLNLPKSTWIDERCASMRFIANAYYNLQNHVECEKWLLRAMAEAPHLREPYIDLAMLYYHQENWYGVLFAAEKALGITTRPMTYINEPRAWGFTPYDLASLACTNIGLYEKAYDYVNQAIKYAPHDKRLECNRQYIKEHL